jgi:hypothetical protein
MRDLTGRARPRTSDDIAAWRAHRLLDAGFSEALAWDVARDLAYDLPAVLELVGRGCATDLAARILAPLSPV